MGDRGILLVSLAHPLTAPLTAPNPFPACQFTYTLIVSNAGTAAMTNTTLTDDLPEGLEALSIEPSDACKLARAGGAVSCSLGTVAPGGSVVVAVVAKATMPVSATGKVCLLWYLMV